MIDMLERLLRWNVRVRSSLDFVGKAARQVQVLKQSSQMAALPCVSEDVASQMIVPMATTVAAHRFNTIAMQFSKTGALEEDAVHIWLC